MNTPSNINKLKQSFRIPEKRETGFSIVGAIFLISVLAIMIAIGWYIYCDRNKAYWDSQVKALCEKDGGVKVYEKVSISYELYRQLGGNEYGLPIYSKSAKNSAPFFTEETTTNLHDSNPWVRRTETKFIQRDGNRTIAVHIYFSRVGGDFPSWGHHSSYGCDIPKGGFTKQFILVEGN